MFHKNDLVLYRTEGVYRVEDICVPDISGTSDRLYYVMQSLSTQTTAYTPVDAEVNMRRICSRPEALKALSELREMEAVDLSTLSHKHLKDFYAKAIKDQNFTNLLALYKSINQKKDSLEGTTKKLCQTDTAYLRKILTLLTEEIALCFDIKDDEAVLMLDRALSPDLN
ncbi:CarD family transcriptional regulator [Proteiniclasticum sp. QWL-01]|nr:CarD family transcriptional regulator [Proteiniclasticum sp. QWL-01]UUM12627.1 hypothetical protein NQU17_03440 [Clostridiaceae bacterium HFYG-1003]WFF74182.1 CarD family transcriptional regulator [Proteiniclasticum sp. QWL-01]